MPLSRRNRFATLPTGDEVVSRQLRFFPVLSLALALRIAAAALMFQKDPQIWFYNQASELTCLAHSILSGHGLSSPFGGSTGPSAFLTPGYPYFVALVYRLFGASSFKSALAITGIQIIFGVLIVLLVMLLARRLFGNSTAYIAGTLCALAPTMVWLPTLFWETSVSTLALIGIVAFVLSCTDLPKTYKWIAIGLCCGFTMLVNPALLVTFGALGVWATLKVENFSWRGPLLAAVACAAVFVTWPIRNAVTLHAFVPLRSNLGYELWQGNRPGSQGLFNKDFYLNANGEEYSRYKSLGELPYIHEKSSIAMEAIKADPIRFLRLSLKRTGIFWTALGGHGISWIVIGEITLSSLFGITGLIVLLRQRTESGGLMLLPFFFFPLPYYLTHPDFRFRLLLEPLALLADGMDSRTRLQPREVPPRTNLGVNPVGNGRRAKT